MSRAYLCRARTRDAVRLARTRMAFRFGRRRGPVADESAAACAAAGECAAGKSAAAGSGCHSS